MTFLSLALAIGLGVFLSDIANLIVRGILASIVQRRMRAAYEKQMAIMKEQFLRDAPANTPLGQFPDVDTQDLN